MPFNDDTMSIDDFLYLSKLSANERLDATQQPLSYEEWLYITGCSDCEETRGWYECPDEKRGEYIRNHKNWWKKFCKD